MTKKSDPLRKAQRRYPGRQRVLSREDARDYLYRRDIVGQSHDCSDPVPVAGIGLPGFLDQGKPLPVEFSARCRKCPECLAHRRRLWTARAVDEIQISQRTWFGTLTVAPHMRFQVECIAETSLRVGGEYLSDLSDTERFAYLASHLGMQVTRFLKRVRKTIPGLRYLLVFEKHKDGWPHVHLLLHESLTPVRKAVLESQWRLGFSHWRLVDREAKAATYVCKYLAKDALTRVRASQNYGQSHKVRVIAERAKTASSELKKRVD